MTWKNVLPYFLNMSPYRDEEGVGIQLCRHELASLILASLLASSSGGGWRAEWNG